MARPPLLAVFPPATQDFFGVRKILLLVGFGPVIAMLAALALWRLWPSSPSDEAVIFSVGAQKLRFAATYLRNPEPTEADRVDLTVLAPDFSPGAVDPQRIPAAGDKTQKGRAQIFITLTPALKIRGQGN